MGYGLAGQSNTRIRTIFIKDVLSELIIFRDFSLYLRLITKRNKNDRNECVFEVMAIILNLGIFIIFFAFSLTLAPFIRSVLKPKMRFRWCFSVLTSLIWFASQIYTLSTTAAKPTGRPCLRPRRQPHLLLTMANDSLEFHLWILYFYNLFFSVVVSFSFC